MSNLNLMCEFEFLSILFLCLGFISPLYFISSNVIKSLSLYEFSFKLFRHHFLKVSDTIGIYFE